jgi:hypothetical protein
MPIKNLLASFSTKNNAAYYNNKAKLILYSLTIKSAPKEGPKMIIYKK